MGPLEGIRVLEVGHAIAGPYAGSLLAYFGADVVKVETPGTGDPLRVWRHLEKGVSLFFRSLARNKRCITLDLRDAQGQALCRKLIERSDVLIENFTPGTMESWGLGPEQFAESNPGLVYTRISGFGQTGPYAKRPGFAAVCEAMGGLRFLTGHPGEPPVRANLSLGDSLGGLTAAFGVALALVARQKDGRGQVIDVALTEAVLNVLESVIPERTRAGIVRHPAGVTITGLAPSNIYECSNGRVVIGANGDALFVRLMLAIGRPDLAHDRELASNPGRVKRVDELDRAIGAYTKPRTVEDVERELTAVEVPVGPIYDATRIVDDPHYRARGLFERVDLDGSPLEVAAYAPKLSRTAGATRFAGPDLSAHTAEVLAEIGVDVVEIARLRREGVV